VRVCDAALFFVITQPFIFKSRPFPEKKMLPLSGDNLQSISAARCYSGSSCRNTNSLFHLIFDGKRKLGDDSQTCM
jgi:hypothetical protein